MSYRITESINLPFRVLPVITELGRTRIEINVKVNPHARTQAAAAVDLDAGRSLGSAPAAALAIPLRALPMRLRGCDCQPASPPAHARACKGPAAARRRLP